MATLKERSQAILDEKNAKILPENIKKDVQIFDIVGTMEEGIDTSDATAIAKDMVYGKTAYVNGEKITGTVGEDINTDLSYRLNTLEDVPSMKMLSARSVDLPWDRLVRAGCNYSMNIPYETAANTVGLTADKITKGNTILGIEGTGTEINNQDKEITANGTYTADEGYTGLGTVTVNIPQEGGSGDVKLFTTQEEMQSDTTAQEGDLAIVYTNTIKHLTSSDVGKQIDYLILPDIITLSTPFTGEYETISLNNRDAGLSLRIEMNTSMLMFDGYADDGQFMGNYNTQSDGVTLKKSRFDIMTTDVTLENNVLKFSQPMTIASIESDLIGETCIVSRHTFEGLYQANPILNKDDIDVLRSFSGYSDISTVREDIHVGADKITEVRNALIAAGIQKNGIIVFNGDTADYIYYKGDYDGFWGAMVNGELCIVCSINYESSSDTKIVMPMIKATYDFTTKQITNTEFETVPTIDQSNYTKQVAFNATGKTWMLLSTKSDIIGSYDNGDLSYMNRLNIWVGSASNSTYIGYSHNKYKYELAEQ